MSRLIDYDPFTDVSTYFHYDENSDVMTIESVQDVEPLIDKNKMLQNSDNYSKNGIKNEWWHAASIPIVIQYKWMTEDGIDVMNKEHWPKIRKKLNDPEYRYLKTTTGHV